MNIVYRLFSVVLIGVLLQACTVQDASVGKAPAQSDVLALAAEISALDPSIDPAEAQRAAQVTYDHTRALAVAYEITDPPLIHNAKVNRGTKPRGLCWHWAEDIETRLKAENFQTLSLHRAIANHDKPFLIEHSTTIISARGKTMFDGVVVDPWRKGGVLFWAKTTEDTRYDWTPRQEVFDWKRARGTLVTRVVSAQ